MTTKTPLSKRIITIGSVIGALSVILTTTWPFNPYVLADRIDDNEKKIEENAKQSRLIYYSVQRDSVKDDIRELSKKEELTQFEEKELEELEEKADDLKTKIVNLEEELDL